MENGQAAGKAEVKTEKKTAAPAEKKGAGSAKKGSAWSVVLGAAQLAAVGLYGFLAFRNIADFASENAIDIVETAVDDLGLQEIVISENLLLFVGIVCAVLAIASLVSTVFLIVQKRALKRAAMYISIAAELVAVVGVALFFAFKANLFFLLFFIPHVVWYGIVIAYTAVSTADPEAAARRKAEKEAKKRAEAEEEEAVEETEEAPEEAADVPAAETTTAVAAAPAAKKTVVRKVVVEEQEDAAEEVGVVKKRKKAAKPKAKKKKTKIKFVLYWIIAAVHTAVLGLIMFVGSVINAIASNSEDYDIMFQNFLRDFEVRDVTITKTQLMSVFILHALVSVAFMVTGLGLIRRSKRFADVTKHFTLGVLILMALSLLMQGFASFTIMMGVYFAWFLFVTIYFRVADLEGFLRVPAGDDDEDPEPREQLTDL